MSRLELHIDGKKKDVVGLNFVANSIIVEKQLINNAIEKLKIENRKKMENREWKIFLIHKSKIALLLAFLLFFSSCYPSKIQRSEMTFLVTNITELSSGFRKVYLLDTDTKKRYTSRCTCDTLYPGKTFTINVIHPVKNKTPR
jgi:hypothetical protein